MSVRLPPVPTRRNETQDFLLEIAHIVNNECGESFGARIGSRTIRVRSCFLTLNDGCEEMEFVINSMDNTTNPAWHAVVSLISIATFGSGFWVELVATDQPPVVLYMNHRS